MWGLPEIHSPNGRLFSVHPHVCGVYVLLLYFRHYHVRFIPTYVGATVTVNVRTYNCSVHPHVCGVYLLNGSRPVIASAVHPHVCGVYESTATKVDRLQRFIPTYVGSTPSSGGNAWGGSAVHPHVCGVYELNVRKLKTTPAVHPHVCGVYLI